MRGSVHVENLSVRFGEFYAVRDISFEVQAGEIFGFLGANGAGKTTTIRVLCGLLPPSAGSVWVAGSSALDGMDLIKSKVGYMSQKFTLYNDLTVEENLAFTANLRKLPKNTLTKRTKELFEFTGFERSADTSVGDLPAGIKQQVSLVATLLHDPEVIFLDEPTAGVTPAARARFWVLIRHLSATGKTVFVTTHYMDEAEQCDRIALMRTGQIIALDTPSGLKSSSFPEPLFELEPPENPVQGWLDRIKEDPSILSVQPYGLRYHVAARDPKRWDELAETVLRDFQVTRITPSLEDVFIRLVEGVHR